MLYAPPGSSRRRGAPRAGAVATVGAGRALPVWLLLLASLSAAGCLDEPEENDAAPSTSAQALARPNLAQGKVATQSSTYGGAAAGRAVDGNTNGAWSAGSVTHTGLQSHAWWQVDLGRVESIGEVVLHNRTDCCGNRLSNFNVRFSVDGANWSDVAYPGTVGANASFVVSKSARYVRVELNGSNYLSLAEVQVFPANRTTDPVTAAITNLGDDAARRWMVDVTGDGRADYCRSIANALRCDFSTGDGFSGSFSAPIADWGYADRRWMVDFDGDGRADYCRAVGSGAGTHLACSLSTGTGLSGERTVLAPVRDWGYGGRRWMADFNGDGRADYCRAVGSGDGTHIGCSFSTGTGLGAEYSVLASVTDWGYSDRRWMVDFNGDGRADYCRAVGSGSGTHLACSLSTGTAFAGVYNVMIPVTDWGYGDRRWLVDFDHDGWTDYCRAVGSNSGTHVACQMSAVGGRSSTHTELLPVSNWGYTRFMADFDGNHVPDFARTIDNAPGTALLVDRSVFCASGLTGVDGGTCVRLVPWVGGALPDGARIAMRASQHEIYGKSYAISPAWAEARPNKQLEVRSPLLSKDAIYTVEAFADGVDEPYCNWLAAHQQLRLRTGRGKDLYLDSTGFISTILPSYGPSPLVMVLDTSRAYTTGLLYPHHGQFRWPIPEGSCYTDLTAALSEFRFLQISDARGNFVATRYQFLFGYYNLALPAARFELFLVEEP